MDLPMLKRMTLEYLREGPAEGLLRKGDRYLTTCDDSGVGSVDFDMSEEELTWDLANLSSLNRRLRENTLKWLGRRLSGALGMSPGLAQPPANAPELTNLQIIYSAAELAQIPRVGSAKRR